MRDLKTRLEATKRLLLKLSDVAAKQKKFKEAKEFDLHAVSVDEPIDLIKNINE